MTTAGQAGAPPAARGWSARVRGACGGHTRRVLHSPGTRAAAWVAGGRFVVLRSGEVLLAPSRRLLALSEPLTDLVAAPDGRHVLVAAPAAGQWLVVSTQGGRLTAFDSVARQFDPGGDHPDPVPRPLAWIPRPRRRAWPAGPRASRRAGATPRGSASRRAAGRPRGRTGCGAGRSAAPTRPAGACRPSCISVTMRGIEVLAGRGQPVLVALGLLLVEPPLQDPGVDERVQPRREDVARDAEVALHVREAPHAVEGLAQDQERPALAQDLHRARRSSSCPDDSARTSRKVAFSRRTR